MELMGGGVVLRIYQILADIFTIYFGMGERKGEGVCMGGAGERGRFWRMCKLCFYDTVTITQIQLFNYI